MPDKNPLSAEEMACLVDGRGTDAQVREWQQRLVYHREQREEYAELAEAAGEDYGTVEEHVVDQLAEKYFPKPALEQIWIKIKEKGLELVESKGWAQPALDYRGPDGEEASILNFSRRVDNLDIEFQVVRLKKHSLNLTVGVKDPANDTSPSMKVSLIRQGRILNSRHLEQSQARFKEVLPGEYDISMTGPEGESLKVSLKIGE